MEAHFPELGCYLLPGHSRTPADLLSQVQEAERLGMGSAWISERVDVKEMGVLVGAAAAVTRSIFICSGVTNINTRHPVITASLATTASRLSGGRFALGVGRGVGVSMATWGVPVASNAMLRDFVGLMRRLWQGERVFGHEGPLGSYPYLHLADWLEEAGRIPLLLGAYGPKSLALAGAVFDGVLLPTFFSDAAVRQAVAHVRRGAEEAGRDPHSVKVWAMVATLCHPDEEQRLRFIVGRMATYLQAPDLAELLIAANGWDEAVLERFRAAPVVAGMRGGIDSTATLDELREIETLIPAEWYPAAVGDAAHCARRWADQFRAGADGVVIHASTPAQFAPILPEYAALRDAAAFAGRSNRPC
ncbi:MAG: TIGR03857 family LLM class F420-dependent oxidoreductase [Sterolibacterium sp.]|nr:TIGR03857 family LLM class F420-dependent oxidoreductase [Sterolibacterium sp.]MBP9800231.1 TIGR03857 family LLM class F420-dependent oxidoreductase [Sterolibacterium sp.]